MPIYEYECTCCPSRFELRRSFTDDSPVSCPKCGGKVRRIFSPLPIIFKGSGFYVTDSRSKQGHPPDEGGTAKAKVDTDKAKVDNGKTKVSSTAEETA